MQTLKALDGVLQLFSPALLALQEQWWISVVLGSSPQRAQEVYDILFSVPSTSARFIFPYRGPAFLAGCLISGMAFVIMVYAISFAKFHLPLTQDPSCWTSAVQLNIID